MIRPDRVPLLAQGLRVVSEHPVLPPFTKSA
jgi:hypothetical protein